MIKISTIQFCAKQLESKEEIDFRSKPAALLNVRWSFHSKNASNDFRLPTCAPEKFKNAAITGGRKPRVNTCFRLSVVGNDEKNT